MLELAGVTAAYGEIVAVRDVDLAVRPGETVALVGRNGAGKTTTLRLAAGVVAPLRGTVRWDGEDIAGCPPEERIRRGIVLVPEGRGIFPALTVEENLRLGAYWRRPPAGELGRDIDEVHDLLPVLAARRHQSAGSLSGGEQQLLAIGRALLSKPRLLLLDEPSMGLAPRMVETLYALLAQLKERRLGLIVVEQHVRLALQLCDRVLGLNKGVVTVEGAAGELDRVALDEVYLGRGALT
jgi:branched-chain amino acid transport system ATP-binding protein